ncbi:MAG: peptidyl-prolyl cis-trans isomerase [Burkholderiales bacterium]|nr:peptidyl-prolyl cis-trans isomerase [Burkholderiales bacterium]
MLRILPFLLAGVLAAPPAIAADPRVELTTTQGAIVLELDAEKAPVTVANFLRYVKEGHYDGTQFHRVIDGFMIQGGGFDRTFGQKRTHAPIKNEADNGLKNDYGTVAMARTSDPDSATAQFFINLKNNDFLNHREPTQQGWGYTVFGRVVEGMDIVNRIAKLPTGSLGPYQNVPTKPVMIERARILNGK